ncbi:hypothetical protein A9G29_11520 [Gilliamella sp. Fer2-1]|jgi:hypothetical protein|nr:hypothetical protein A9G29_11520 [Gilliamella apicola]
MKKILIFITVLFLFGCNEKTYTVEEFKNNKELREEYNKKCENGELDSFSLVCRNAADAEFSLMIGAPLERNPNAWK